MKKIYLDYASTTPVDIRVTREMNPFFSKKFGNSMSLHSFGQEAKISLEESRDKIAKAINANSEEIIFTSSATESNNLALKGIAFAKKKGHIIISSIEHHCVLESAYFLKKMGFEISVVRVDKYGIIDIEDLKNKIREDTFLISIIHASNEIGTIQPIEDIGKICKEKNIYFHTDASQSFGKVKIDVEKMNIDLLTASGHKIYGPKGVGMLFIKKRVKLDPLLHGGGQENGLRSSTVNVASIVGFAKATELCLKEMNKEEKRLIKLREKVIKEMLKIKGSFLNGHPKNRLPNNINLGFSFIEGESLIIQLDMKGIAVSTGSACSSATLEPSHVLLALGLRHEEVHGSVRITMGRWTKEEEVNYLIKVLPPIINQLRKISPFYEEK